jgi:hypothetical protein
MSGEDANGYAYLVGDAIVGEVVERRKALEEDEMIFGVVSRSLIVALNLGL